MGLADTCRPFGLASLLIVATALLGAQSSLAGPCEKDRNHPLAWYLSHHNAASDPHYYGSSELPSDVTIIGGPEEFIVQEPTLERGLPSPGWGGVSRLRPAFNGAAACEISTPDGNTWHVIVDATGIDAYVARSATSREDGSSYPR